MAKGLRSKSKQRYKLVKRQHISETVERQKAADIQRRLEALYSGRDPNPPSPPNAFLEPENPAAVFPQRKNVQVIDLRADSLPAAGYATIGNRRKYTSDEVQFFMGAIGKVPGKTIYPPKVAAKQSVDEAMVFEYDNGEMVGNGMIRFGDCNMDVQSETKEWMGKDMAKMRKRKTNESGGRSSAEAVKRPRLVNKLKADKHNQRLKRRRMNSLCVKRRRLPK